jgi:hypothetical protein
VTVIAACWLAGGWAVEKLAHYVTLAFQRMSQHL